MSSIKYSLFVLASFVILSACSLSAQAQNMHADQDDIVIPQGAGTFRSMHGYTIDHRARCLTYTTQSEVQIEGASFRLRSLAVDGNPAPSQLLRRIEQGVMAEGYFKYIAVICNDGADVRVYFYTRFSDHDRDDESEPVVAVFHPDTGRWDD